MGLHITTTASMELFIKLPKFLFIICKNCRFAYVANDIDPHIKLHHKGIGAPARKAIVQQVGSIPGIIKKQEELLRWPKPPPTTNPIPFIQPPSPDKLGYNEDGCLYVTSTT